MIEYVLIAIFLGFISFFILFKLIGELIKSFFIVSLLMSVAIVVLGFFVYSDISDFVRDDKLVLFDFSDSRFDSGFFVKGSSFSGDIDSSLSSDVVSDLFVSWNGNRSEILRSYSRVVYVNVSGSSFEENISSFLSSVDNFNPRRDSFDDLDLDFLSSLGVDRESLDLVDFTGLKNFDSFDDLSSSLGVPISFDFDSAFLISFLKEKRIEFYPNSIGFRVLDYVPSFAFDIIAGSLFRM